MINDKYFPGMTPGKHLSVTNLGMKQLGATQVLLCDIISCYMVFLDNVNKMAPWLAWLHFRKLTWLTWFPKLIIIFRAMHYFYFPLNSSNVRLFQTSWWGVLLRILPFYASLIIWYKVSTPHWHFCHIPPNILSKLIITIHFRPGSQKRMCASNL